MDRIIESYLRDFIEEFELDTSDPTVMFEHFSNYCVMSKFCTESLFPEEVSVGGGQDLGIDGLAILVNEHLINTSEQVDYYTKAVNRLESQFIFVQSKTSSNFDGGELGTFLFGVRSFFSKHLSMPVNERVKDRHQLKEHVYDMSKYMENSPVCRIYYVTLGRWVDDPMLVSRIDEEISQLRQTNLFSAVEFHAIDAEKLQNMYRELRNKIVREINFEKHTILPKMDNVQEAYIGIIPTSEYLKLISDSEGYIKRSLFYDNVRDFQGDNPVNNEIGQTIEDQAIQGHFALFNNGVTIVAKSMNKVGTTFKLNDFQIVNGCQTSNVLFNHRDVLKDSVWVPIKLIVTKDNEVTNRIIKATNRQTEVKVEAFEALSPFHKKLEEYYASFDKTSKSRLYYERRSKQYDNEPIKKNRIITIAAQVNSFVAMFLNEPHSTHRYYGELLKSYKDRVFLENHKPSPYHLGSYCLFKIENYLRDHKYAAYYKKYRYHMAMLFRIMKGTRDIPSLSGKKIDAYCTNLLEELDAPQFESRMTEILSVIDTARNESPESDDENIRRRSFTVRLLELYKLEATMAIGETVDCVVMKVIPTHVHVEVKGVLEKCNIYIANLADGWIESIHEVVSVGQSLRAKVIGYDNRHGWQLSVKDLT